VRSHDRARRTSSSPTAPLGDDPRSRGVAVRADQVVKAFGTGDERVTAVADVSLEIEPGSLTALTGASGSGKSTLLHLLAAIERPTSGTIEVGSRELSALRGRDLSDYRRSVGLVFQRFNLLPALTVLDNVIAPVLPYRTAFDKQARALQLLAAVGLADRSRAIPSQLSGGQQQRVAIARALVNSPSILLADEPTGNLDSANGQDILRLILDLRVEHGATVIIATHDHGVAAQCERVVTLSDGRLFADTATPAP